MTRREEIKLMFVHKARENNRTHSREDTKLLVEEWCSANPESDVTDYIWNECSSHSRKRFFTEIYKKAKRMEEVVDDN